MTHHFGKIVHHTTRGAKGGIIILISRCSGPVLRTVNGRTLLARCHGALGTFCKTLGSVSTCLHFTLLANIAGFDGVDIFDSLGGLRSVSLRRTCGGLYNVARRRLLRGFRRKVHILKRRGRVTCRRAYGDLQR